MVMKLRELRADDVDPLTKILNEPKVSKYMCYPEEVSRLEVEDWLYTITQNPNNMLFVIDVDSKPVGCVRLERYGGKQSHVARLRIWISGEYQDKGIGREAINRVIDYAKKRGIERIEAEVIEYNQRAIHLYTALGFTKQAVLEKRVKDNGDYYDVLVFGKMI
jgi:RimJ/RimL family protein N-acetyltransferase